MILVKTDDLIEFLIEVEKTCELIWKSYFKLVMCLAITIPMTAVSSVYFDWILNERFSVDHFYHVYKFVYVIHGYTLINPFFLDKII